MTLCQNVTLPTDGRDVVSDGARLAGAGQGGPPHLGQAPLPGRRAGVGLEVLEHDVVLAPGHVGGN